MAGLEQAGYSVMGGQRKTCESASRKREICARLIGLIEHSGQRPRPVALQKALVHFLCAAR